MWPRPTSAEGDVATDALVILEYRAMGADAAVFFHLSAGIFALSSLVFSAIFVAVYLEERADLSERLKDALGRRCRTLVLLALVALALALAPVGQALPVVMWAGEYQSSRVNVASPEDAPGATE